MTKSIRTLFTACVATMLWAACDNNSLTEQAAPCEDVHIRVAAPTRAAKSDFAEGDSIGIFAVERSIEQTAALPSIRPGRANNAKWVRDAEGNWYPATVADRITWSQSGTRMDFYAYYPYDPSLTDPCSIVLNLTRQTAGSDVLRAVNSQGLTKGEVLLSFDHVLSRIDVWITRRSHLSVRFQGLDPEDGSLSAYRTNFKMIFLTNQYSNYNANKQDEDGKHGEDALCTATTQGHQP